MFSEKVNGKFTSCVGCGNYDACKWYGLKQQHSGIQIPQTELIICEYCADNAFTPKELYVNNIIGDNYSCDMTSTNILLKHGYDRRCLHYSKLRFNVNHISATNSSFRPTPIQSSTRGMMVIKLPYGAYWEFVIRANPKFDLGNGKYYIKYQMNSVSGNIVETPKDYLPLMDCKLYRISNYSTMRQSTFQYTDQDSLKDSTFKITVDLYQAIIDDNCNADFEYKRTISVTLKIVNEFEKILSVED